MNTSSAQVRLWIALPITTMFMLVGATPAVVAAAGRVLEEIVVSAQKCGESLQDIPISASAVSGGEVNLCRYHKSRSSYGLRTQLQYEPDGHCQRGFHSRC